jgi:hypothetical protein
VGQIIGAIIGGVAVFVAVVIFLVKISDRKLPPESKPRVIVIPILKWDRIVNWFRAREELKNSDKDNIAFTLQEKLKNGKYKTVQGIFNTRTNELLDEEKIISEQIDDRLVEVHRNYDLVIYE